VDCLKALASVGPPFWYPYTQHITTSFVNLAQNDLHNTNISFLSAFATVDFTTRLNAHYLLYLFNLYIYMVNKTR